MLDIEVVSDVVCPWCLIGTARLGQALAERKDLEARVRFSPFLLQPSVPEEGVDLRDHLRNKYGGDPDRMFARVEAEARSSGIALDFAKIRRFPSTLRAHALIDLAGAAQGRIARALFDAYFLEGRDISDREVLVEIGAAQGLEPGDVRAAITDAARLARVRSLAEAQVRRGVTGVPFFVLDERLAIPGAVPIEVFRRALDQALAS
ncbi:MAG: DsbA family oxidoreductase [Sandaracinaceae bacterium]|nr:DsbA family oxidoreductase [Sandaracinaceae bacterium]